MTDEKNKTETVPGVTRADLEKSFRSFEKQTEQIYIGIFKESFPNGLPNSNLSKRQQRAKKD